MRAYKEYKQIGLPWLDQIPAHWKIVRNKNVLTSEDETVGNESNKYQLLSLSLHGVIIRDVESGKGKFPKDFDSYKIVKPNRIIFCLFDMDETPRTVGLSTHYGMITGAYDVFHVSGVNEKYIYYYYIALDDVKALKPLYTGLRKVISLDKFLSTSLPLPPREEQDAIVRFLDAKCAKIDSLIKLKERQIALLNEKKQSIINQAVTRGLDPNAPMKDSGVDWIGESPEGWEVLRCKYLFTETNVRSEKGEETHLSMSQKYGLVPDSMMEEKRMLSESYAGGKLCCKDDIVLNRLKAHLGVFALASQDGVVSPDYTVLSINKNRIFSHYAECILKSYSCRRELVIRVRGIVNGFLRLYTEDFNTIKLPLPTIDEQKRIMEFVSKIERIIKTKIDILENNILLMNEYRQRLISDVVTGKINILEGNSDV